MNLNKSRSFILSFIKINKTKLFKLVALFGLLKYISILFTNSLALFSENLPLLREKYCITPRVLALVKFYLILPSKFLLTQNIIRNITYFIMALFMLHLLANFLETYTYFNSSLEHLFILPITRLWSNLKLGLNITDSSDTETIQMNELTPAAKPKTECERIVEEWRKKQELENSNQGMLDNDSQKTLVNTSGIINREYYIQQYMINSPNEEVSSFITLILSSVSLSSIVNSLITIILLNILFITIKILYKLLYKHIKRGQSPIKRFTTFKITFLLILMLFVLSCLILPFKDIISLFLVPITIIFKYIIIILLFMLLHILFLFLILSKVKLFKSKTLFSLFGFSVFGLTDLTIANWEEMVETRRLFSELPFDLHALSDDEFNIVSYLMNWGYSWTEVEYYTPILGQDLETSGLMFIPLIITLSKLNLRQDKDTLKSLIKKIGAQSALFIITYYFIKNFPLLLQNSTLTIENFKIFWFSIISPIWPSIRTLIILFLTFIPILTLMFKCIVVIVLFMLLHILFVYLSRVKHIKNKTIPLLSTIFFIPFKLDTITEESEEEVEDFKNDKEVEVASQPNEGVEHSDVEDNIQTSWQLPISRSTWTSPINRSDDLFDEEDYGNILHHWIIEDNGITHIWHIEEEPSLNMGNIKTTLRDYSNYDTDETQLNSNFDNLSDTSSDTLISATFLISMKKYIKETIKKWFNIFKNKVLKNRKFWSITISLCTGIPFTIPKDLFEQGEGVRQEIRDDTDYNKVVHVDNDIERTPVGEKHTIDGFNVKPFWEIKSLNKEEHSDDCDSVNSDYGEIINEPQKTVKLDIPNWGKSSILFPVKGENELDGADGQPILTWRNCLDDQLDKLAGKDTHNLIKTLNDNNESMFSINTVDIQENELDGSSDISDISDMLLDDIVENAINTALKSSFLIMFTNISLFKKIRNLFNNNQELTLKRTQKDFMDVNWYKDGDDRMFATDNTKYGKITKIYNREEIGKNNITINEYGVIDKELPRLPSTSDIRSTTFELNQHDCDWVPYEHVRNIPTLYKFLSEIPTVKDDFLMNDQIVSDMLDEYAVLPIILGSLKTFPKLYTFLVKWIKKLISLLIDLLIVALIFYFLDINYIIELITNVIHFINEIKINKQEIPQTRSYWTELVLSLICIFCLSYFNLNTQHINHVYEEALWDIARAIGR